MTVQATFGFDKKYYLDLISDSRHPKYPAGKNPYYRMIRDYVDYVKGLGATDEEVNEALKKGGYLE